MKNITKLSFWPEIEKLGFSPVRFYSQGKFNAMGAGLRDAQNREYITVEPMTFEWRVSSQFGSVIHVDFCDTKNLRKTIMEAVENNTGQYLVQFYNDQLQFCSPLLYSCINIPQKIEEMMEKAGAKLKSEVDMYYTNGEPKTGTWYCTFSALKPFSQDCKIFFESDELYKKRIKIKFDSHE